MTIFLETLIYGEGKDLNLCNNLTFGYCAFPGTSHNWLPHPDFFCLYLKVVFKVVAWAVLGSYSVFLGVSHVHRRNICYSTSLCFSPVIFLLPAGGGRGGECVSAKNREG